MNTDSPSLRNLLDKPARGKPIPSAQPADDESDYSAYAQGRISRHPQLTLVFRLADGSVKAFAYAYLYASEGIEPACRFTLDFTHHKVKLQGRNLETLFRLICQHRVAEVREAERSHSFEVSPEAPLVERIEVVAS